jgi:hypothetical protein
MEAAPSVRRLQLRPARARCQETLAPYRKRRGVNDRQSEIKTWLAALMRAFEGMGDSNSSLWVESILVCNRGILEEIYPRPVLTFAEDSASVSDIMPREASSAEGRFVQTAFSQLRR